MYCSVTQCQRMFSKSLPKFIQSIQFSTHKKLLLVLPSVSKPCFPANTSTHPLEYLRFEQRSFFRQREENDLCLKRNLSEKNFTTIFILPLKYPKMPETRDPNGGLKFIDFNKITIRYFYKCFIATTPCIYKSGVNKIFRMFDLLNKECKLHAY